MKKITMIIVALVSSMFIGLSLAPTTGAVSVIDTACNSGGTNEVCKAKGDDLNVTIKNVINMLLYLVGIISVISIIVAGIYYVTSTGDQGKVQTAKNTILYAVVGLIVAIMAFAIVNFVVTNIG